MTFFVLTFLQLFQQIRPRHQILRSQCGSGSGSADLNQRGFMRIRIHNIGLTKINSGKTPKLQTILLLKIHFECERKKQIEKHYRFTVVFPVKIFLNINTE